MKEVLVSNDNLVYCPNCETGILKDKLPVQDVLQFPCPKCNHTLELKRSVYG